MKNAKKNKKLMKVTKRKITKCEAKKLHNELTKIDIDALERHKSNGVRKYNILNILSNIGAIFTGAYLHYKDKPKETIFERILQRD